MDAVKVSNYGVGDDLFETLLKVMATSTRRLWIKVAWWDASPKGRQLAEAAIVAQRRGLDVRVLCRPESSNDAVLRQLRQSGVTIVGVRYIHEMEVLADDVAVTHSMNFTDREIERNQNSGLVFDAPDIVGATEAGFLALIENRAAANVGDEEWTPSAKLIPRDLQKYLTRFDRLNPLQSKAVPAVLSTPGHVMVVAPTSAGKTLIGEIAALRSIVTERKPAVWPLPAGALAAEVSETARRWNGHGIRSVELTGETNMSSDTVRNAQLWVATTEKFEALYRRSSLREFIATVGCLIIDEVHLVGDPTRGATLETLIARLRAVEGRTRIVALSATVSNAEELADWFNAQLVRSAWRPTILTTQLVPYDAPPPGSKREEYEAAKDAVLDPLLRELRAPTPDASKVLDGSVTNGMGSVLVFCGSKNGVRRTAAMAARVPFRNVEDEDLAETTFAAGVGMHFRDAPRAHRALDSFKERKIQTLVATSGLSTGMNTPARAVVIRDLELGMSPLEVSQAQQMFGRAGRAGQEPEGFAFMLVPRGAEAEWRLRLARGYTARSQVLDHLGDALLAEILLGSIADRDGASSWFQETFAYAQSGEESDVDDALDYLVLRGFVTESEDGLAVTEIGALTCRLMIDVESAGGLLTALAEAPVPSNADEAEELVLQILATEVLALREWPVNPKVYEDVVAEILFGWTPRITSRMGDSFGSRVCMAAAHLALREPRRLHSKPPPGISLAEFKRAIEDMPRYLAWVAALGYVDQATWAPAVAGELARRLAWWNLSPHPERGSGRLLWLLERLLEPENRKSRMADLWARARRAGFTSPDPITARPRSVDISDEGFSEMLGRADLQLAPLVNLELSLESRSRSSRVTAMSNSGTRRAIATTRPAQGRMDLPVPPSRAANEIAADVFLYTRDGDFSYQNLTADLPDDAREKRMDPVDEARGLLGALPDLTAVGTGPRGLRRVLMSERKKQLQTILPLLSPDPALRPIALALAEHEAEPDLAAMNLRTNLRRLLEPAGDGQPRPAATVLRSGKASQSEFELTLAALAGSLQLETGIASAEGRLLALIRVSGDWCLAMPSDSRNVRIDPVFPASLPPVVSSLQPRPAEDPTPVRPLCSWVEEFVLR
ncbi:DEAD/DEAH box helicase [Nocardioides sp. HB32]